MWQFILTCVCRNDLVTVPLTIFLWVTGASAAEDIVWQVRLQNGRPANCWLGLTRVTQDQQNHFIFNADSRGTKGDWNSCIVVPKGLLKTGEDYVVTLDYEVIQRLSEDSFFFVLARSNRLGYGADKSQKWSGEAGARGTVKLRVSATADDFAVAVGIYKEGAIRIQNLRILRGSGWVTIPLQTNSGDHKPTALPSEVQPFTVDPPSNPAGPVLNLADFGAVANGDSPPAQGADKNHDALVAAIAKCRELKASKLIVPKGVYRISSGDTIVFDGLNDFIFDGDGSTFLFHQIKAHAAGVLIKNCTRTVFSHFNLDWDWKIDPLASVGKIVKVAPDSSFFEMRLETTPRLDPKRWEGITPLDEKLRAPGSGKEFGLAVTKIDPIDSKTVRV